MAQTVKNPLAMQEMRVRYLGWEGPLEKEKGNPLQDSCLEYPMDRRAWWATVHGVAKSWTRLRSKHTFIPQNPVQCLQMSGVCADIQKVQSRV